MAYNEALWKEAKKKCRLNENDIKMAKELGLNPKSLMKNIPNKNQQWKAPVKDWIRELHEERFSRKTPKGSSVKTTELEVEDFEIPF